MFVAVSNFLKLGLAALNLYLAIKKEAKKNEIKNDPLDYFDSKFGSLRSSNEKLQHTSDKSSAEQNPINTK
jgi:hypothetical protein